MSGSVDLIRVALGVMIEGIIFGSPVLLWAWSKRHDKERRSKGFSPRLIFGLWMVIGLPTFYLLVRTLPSAAMFTLVMVEVIILLNLAIWNVEDRSSRKLPQTIGWLICMDLNVPGSMALLWRVFDSIFPRNISWLDFIAEVGIYLAIVLIPFICIHFLVKINLGKTQNFLDITISSSSRSLEE